MGVHAPVYSCFRAHVDGLYNLLNQTRYYIIIQHEQDRKSQIFTSCYCEYVHGIGLKESVVITLPHN